MPDPLYSPCPLCSGTGRTAAVFHVNTGRDLPAGSPCPGGCRPVFVVESGLTQGQVETLMRDRDALSRFKAWVHAYLDARGIPTHPDGPHSQEGCRIGDRMDLVFAERDRLRAFVQAAADDGGIAGNLECQCWPCRARRLLEVQP